MIFWWAITLYMGSVNSMTGPFPSYESCEQNAAATQEILRTGALKLGVKPGNFIISCSPKPLLPDWAMESIKAEAD